MLKKRMAGTQRAAELMEGDEAYQAIFESKATPSQSVICNLPINKLRWFFTADIGFRLYPPQKLEAFSAQLAEEGLFERIIVRPIPQSDCYEILAGHNRTEGGRMAGWERIPAEIVDVTDDRAITIAISTNLLRRQDLSIIERGKAYKALLDAKNRNGKRLAAEETFGDNRQRYNARKIVADFFGVTEYEIRKAIKMTLLIPELQEVLENQPKKLNLACAELIADYDAESQLAFVEMCTIEGYQLNKATVKHIISKCPPPTAQQHSVFEAWRESRAAAEKRLMAPPKEIKFNRKRFAPYLDKVGSDAELEDLFLAFLRERTK